MNKFENIYCKLIDSKSYYDIILLCDDEIKIYCSKYFLSYISPVLEKIIQYDKKEDNIYKIPYKKSKTIRIVLALSFPFVNVSELLDDNFKFNIEVIKLLNEWCMISLLNNIETYYIQKYEKYKLEDIFFFAYHSNFKKLLNHLISITSIKKYESIKESKEWSNIDLDTKLLLSDSVIDNIKKRKFSYYN